VLHQEEERKSATLLPVGEPLKSPSVHGGGAQPKFQQISAS